MTLRQLFSLLRKHLAILIAIPVCFGLVSWAVMSSVPRTYMVQSTMYAVPTETTPPSRDLSSALMYLANGGQAWDVAANLHPDIDLTKYSIEAFKPDTGDVVVVEVSGPSPDDASLIANEVASYACSFAADVLNESGAEVLTLADGKAISSEPSVMKYVIEFVLLGVFIAIALIIVRAQKKD